MMIYVKIDCSPADAHAWRVMNPRVLYNIEKGSFLAAFFVFFY